MCGIIGYIGHEPAFKSGYLGILRLLNRGYDSVGITTINDSDNCDGNEAKKNFLTHKYAGDRAIDRILENAAFHTGSIAILHSRWRTIGDKSDANSHPHLDFFDKFSLVHNGIVENYSELRDELYYDHGYKFRSETDTEVIVNLISFYYFSSYLVGNENHNTKYVVNAIEKALGRVKGTYALAILCIDVPDTIFCVRRGSPLLVGTSVDYDCAMISSECSGFDEQITKYVSIETNDIVSLTKCDGRIIMKSNGHILYDKQSKCHTGTVFESLPTQFAHWTIKEIYDQVNTARTAITNGGRICTNIVKLGGLDDNKELLSCDNIIFLGCGTSLNAGLMTVALFKSIKCFNTVQVHDGAEFSENDIPTYGQSKTCFVFISQSGETKDLHRCLETIKTSCASRKIQYKTVGIINVVDSMIAREVDCGVYLNCGREVAVASTKAFTSQVIVLTLIALWFSQAKPRPNNEFRVVLIRKIRELPDDISRTIEANTEMCKKIAKMLKFKSSIFLLGKDTFYSVAREGALKMKEIGYIHAEGYSSAALKHGPYALLTEGFPVILIMPSNRTIYDELKARGATIISVLIEAIEVIEDDYCLRIPELGHAEVLATVLMQLIAYYLSIEKGINPDYPRNIAKVLSTD